jgi:acetyl-CoA carboxylase biotin carboxyl carrier protein
MNAGKKTPDAPDADIGIDADRVRALARLLEETGLTEIEVGGEGWRVRVAKNAATTVATAAPASVAAMTGAATPAAAPASDVAPDHPGVIKAPMVGIVYTVPEPNAPPFVKVGDAVAEGQTLLLIEAMKVFNPIKAPRAGKLTRMFVANGVPVEYGEPLLILE